MNSLKLIMIELIGYTRLALTGLKRIQITPKSDLQLILGSNGSGKSSLLEEISPLPAVSAYFEKNGSKVSEWMFNGSQYRLESVFNNGSQKHSFYKDNLPENLNPGGTLTVQRQLVKEYFGIDSDIHNLMLGNELFTQMSPTRRREWFTRMGERNYDYALNIFKKLKEKHRDVVGALKLAKFTLVEETAKRLKPEEIESLRNEIRVLKSQLSIAIRNMSQERLNYATEAQVLTDTRSRFIEAVKSLQRYSGFVANIAFNQTEESVKETLQELTIKHESLTKVNQQYSEDYLKLETLHNQIVAAGLNDSLEINQTTDHVKKQIKDIKLSIFNLDLIEDTAKIAGSQNVNGVISSVETYLRELSVRLPNNRNRHLSRKNELTYETSLNEINKQLKQKEEQLNTIDRVIKDYVHLKNHANTRCPKCNHVFSQGYSEEAHHQYEQEAKLIVEELKILNTEKEECVKKLTECKQYGEDIAIFIRVLSADYLIPLRQHIAQNYLYDNPEAISGFLDQLAFDLQHYNRLLQLTERLSSLNALQVNELNTQHKSSDQIRLQLNDLLIRMDEISTSIHSTRKDIKQYTYMLEAIQERNALYATAIQLEKQLSKQFENTITSGLDDIYSRLIYELESTIATNESALKAIDIREAYIKEIENDIAKYTQQEKAYSLLVNSLSPTDGIVAESLHGFMKVFIDQNNHFINKVWTYPLRLEMCKAADKEAIELDYKFPFIVKNKSRYADVSLGSKGMKEIFNLAFKMTAMQHLKLNHYPLFLDEFASSFDKEHRIIATHVINSLMNHHAFSQLFMVSHYEDSYTPLMDADVCVLSDSNVVVPVSDRVNHHVIME